MLQAQSHDECSCAKLSLQVSSYGGGPPLFAQVAIFTDTANKREAWISMARLGDAPKAAAFTQIGV